MKIMTLAILALSVLTVGCALIKSTSPKGYQSGRLAAAVYLDTKPFQSEQVNTAARISYQVLCRVTAGDMSDLNAIVAQEVAKITAGSDSVLLAELVLSYYNTALNNLMAEVGVLYPSPEAMQVLINFQKGVQDVLDAYKK
jgi:hypothetical protein